MMTFSEWAQSVVGLRYRTFEGVCLCVGYRPEAGFVLRNASGQEREVSERAIGRTVHPVCMTYGAWRALKMSGDKIPSASELNPDLVPEEAGSLHTKVLNTLMASGLVGHNLGGDPFLTELGKRVYEAIRKDSTLPDVITSIRASDFGVDF